MNTNVITGLGLCSVKYHFVEECHECEGREGGGVQTIIATTIIITTASARHLRGTFLGSVSYWICPPFVFPKSQDRCNIDGPEDINDNQEGRQAVNHSILSASAAMPCNAHKTRAAQEQPELSAAKSVCVMKALWKGLSFVWKIFENCVLFSEVEK